MLVIIFIEDLHLEKNSDMLINKIFEAPSLVLYGSVTVSFLFAFMMLFSKSKRLLYAVIIVAYVIGSYFYYYKYKALCETGSGIISEFVSPAKMSTIGWRTIESLEREGRPDERGIGDNEVDLLLSVNQGFINDAKTEKDRERRLRWVTQYGMTSTPHSAYRGRYIHHYSTILNSVREFKAGNVVDPVYCQYGYVSVVPAIILKGVSFQYYSAIGMLFIVVYIVFGVYILKMCGLQLKYALLSMSVIFLIIVGSVDILALRMAPGFAFYRYMPVFLMVGVTMLMLQYERYFYVFMLVGFAVINSMQYNILYLIALLSVFIFKYFLDRKITLIMLWSGIGVACALFFQLIVYFVNRGVFNSNMFASVGGGHYSYTYALIVLAVPAILLLANMLIYVGRCKNIYDRYVLLYSGAVCLVFAAYPIAFEGSPGHYVGYLLSAVIPYAYMFGLILQGDYRNMVLKYIFILISVLALLWVGLRYKYFKYVPAASVVENELYREARFGSNLYFEMPNDIVGIDVELNALLYKYSLKRRDVYFISRDKIYVELYEDRNYYPINFDAFVNFSTIDIDDMYDEMRRRGVKYMIIDSSSNLLDMDRFLGYMNGRYVDEREVTAYKKLNAKLLLLGRRGEVHKIEDHGRWTLYVIK